MKKLILMSAIAGLALVACEKQPQKQESMNEKSGFKTVEVQPQKLSYPRTTKGDVVDEYFGTKVADPYRWLEDDRSKETGEWVDAQNKVTHKYLNQISFRDDVRKRLEDFYNYEKQSTPFKEGDYTYFYKNDGLQNQSVLYRKLGENGGEELFLDPNTFSEKGTTSMSGVSFSKDGSLVAYQLSEGGSDWRSVQIMDVDSKEVLDELKNIKFSGLSWYGNDGIYYSSYDKPKGSELTAKTDQHKVYYHKIGTGQSNDEVIFGDTQQEKHRYVGAGVTENEKLLVLTAAVSTSGNKLFIKDLRKPNSEFVPVLNSTDNDANIIDADDEYIYIFTNYKAPNQRLVKAPINSPTPEHWVDVIPETDNVLNVSSGGGDYFANYMIDVVSKVVQYDKNGKEIREITLPGQGSVNGFYGKKDAEDVYYSFTNYITPSSSYKFNVKTGETETYFTPDIDFNSSDYESKKVSYTSKDGTKIPMIITHKKGIVLDGNNPTLLYGYGGFNISLTPSYNSLMPVWLEQGGVYAVANLRGGGEYGKVWHDAGTQQKKQNVFDDFIAAGEYLIDENYTNTNKLAINGRSNGGLLVGAVMTQRPDLFQVALPGVGVLDMLRYHTFTAGAGWAYDYGTAEQSKEMFEYLKNYSPVHNVKDGESYPATMVYTADHDDRVVPAHSFKFISELQAKNAGENPILIRIDKDSGHGAGRSTEQLLDEWADVFSFTMYNLGVEPKY